MQTINSIEELESLYEPVRPGAVTKVCNHITPLYHRWINASSFLVLSTVGPEGTDASPRGDSDSVVRINVVRVNGTAKLTAQSEMTSQFDKNKKSPRAVIVVTVNEIYFQCAKALMRSRLWVSDNNREDIPTAGQFIKEIQNGFDADYPEYTKDKMW